MEKVKLTKKFMSNFHHFDNDDYKITRRCSESVLYYSDDEIFKKLLKDYIFREPTVLRLEELQGDSICLPNKAVYERNIFRGYTMPYYKEYKQLEDFIFNKLPFNERKRICLKLCKIIQDLRNQGFAYFDIHPFNVLYYNGKLMLVDMDSGIFSPDRISDSIRDYELFNTARRVGDYQLAITSLGLLFENYQDTIIKQINNNKNELFKNSPNKMVEFYKYAIKRNGNCFEVAEHLLDIDEDYIENAKLILKK